MRASFVELRLFSGVAPILPRLDVEEDVGEIDKQKHDKVGDKDDVADIDVGDIEVGVGVEMLCQNSVLSNVNG